MSKVPNVWIPKILISLPESILHVGRTRDGNSDNSYIFLIASYPLDCHVVSVMSCLPFCVACKALPLLLVRLRRRRSGIFYEKTAQSFPLKQTSPSPSPSSVSLSRSTDNKKTHHLLFSKMIYGYIVLFHRKKPFAEAERR